MKNVNNSNLTHRLILWAVGSLIYHLWFVLLVGYRPEHFVFFAVSTLLLFYNDGSRKILWGAFGIMAYFAMYDSLRIIPNYTVNPIHIAEPYLFEKQLFGFDYLGTIVTPNEYFLTHTHSFFDFISGIGYLLWVPVPLAFMIYFYLHNKRNFILMVYAFVFTNIFGFILYYLYPSAPPWYITSFGFEELPNVKGQAGGLVRFDQIVGLNIFQGMYNKNANVFAAIPSIHAANPVVCLLVTWSVKHYKMAIFSLLLTVVIWFAAVYSNHHYLIDVLLGGIVAILGFLFTKWLMQHSLGNWLRFIETKISTQ